LLISLPTTANRIFTATSPPQCYTFYINADLAVIVGERRE
jgi:hypothetical protein